VCRELGNVLFQPGAGGQIAMPPADASAGGATSVLLTGFEPAGMQFHCLFTWGVAYGEQGFARMTLDVARRLIDPEQLWSAQLARATLDELLEQRAAASARHDKRAAAAALHDERAAAAALHDQRGAATPRARRRTPARRS